jgi:hypothetical protein
MGGSSHADEGSALSSLYCGEIDYGLGLKFVLMTSLEVELVVVIWCWGY